MTLCWIAASYKNQISWQMLKVYCSSRKWNIVMKFQQRDMLYILEYLCINSLHMLVSKYHMCVPAG